MDGENSMQSTPTHLAAETTLVSPQSTTTLSEPRQKYMDDLFAKAKDAHVRTAAAGSQVARCNSRLLVKFEKAFAADPEFDIAGVMNLGEYAKEIARLKQVDADYQRKKIEEASDSKRIKLSHQSSDNVDPNSLTERLKYLKKADQVSIISTLASEVDAILRSRSDSEISPNNVYQVFSNAEVIFQCEGDKRRMILRISERIVVKIVSKAEHDGREHAALRYLHKHSPGLPVPRGLGEIRIKKRFMMFMSYVPGEELEKVWPSLSGEQKVSIVAEIEKFFMALRDIRHPPGQPWGGVGGQPSLDQRRFTRRAKKPIYNANDFKEFFFSKPRLGSKAWIQFLRGFYDLSSSDGSDDECVFTHGDLRLANIMVIPAENGHYQLSGVIDWEHSGWSPSWWEGVKLMDCIDYLDKKDWPLYVPNIISPMKYPMKFLLNHVWEQYLE